MGGARSPWPEVSEVLPPAGEDTNILSLPQVLTLSLLDQLERMLFRPCPLYLKANHFLSTQQGAAVSRNSIRLSEVLLGLGGAAVGFGIVFA